MNDDKRKLWQPLDPETSDMSSASLRFLARERERRAALVRAIIVLGSLLIAAVVWWVMK